MYKESLTQYLDDLAGKKPAPGGGSAAALAAALGASLLSMVGNFTVGKEKYQAVEGQMQQLFAQAEQLRQRLISLVDEDVSAYQEVSRAYSLPKETAEDKRQRAQAIQQALKAALACPLEVCKASAEAVKLCPALAEKGNVNLISDVGVAAALLEAAFQAALLNVEINLGGIKDEQFIVEIRKILDPLEEEIGMLKDDVWRLVKDKLAQETR